MKRRGNPAKRLGLKEIYLHFGLFDFAMICVVGPLAGAEQYVSWKFEDDLPFVPVGQQSYEARGRSFFRKGYIPVIWIPRAPRTPREYGTLAHEILHAVGHLTEWAAIPWSPDSEEVYCHAVGHAMTAILEGLRK